DFNFIYDRVKSFYSQDNGRPPIDPVILFKMMLVGYLFGIRSERQLEKEIQTNVAYRWFLGLNLTDSVPHHSTISFNRHKRFKG
ncbi:IS5/IS1182 family transposase, partial [Alkalihalophilus marmarensis]